MTVAPERLAVVDAAMLFDVLLPALRGHFGIRSSDLVDLARAHVAAYEVGRRRAAG